MPRPNLPQPVASLKNLISNDVLMMQHSEQDDLLQKSVTPSSPTLHVLRVPCHRRFSFPRDLPMATKFPLVSTSSLRPKN